MDSAGLRTELNYVDEEALVLIKTQLGISSELSSCHTATIGSYFVEGHVPAEDIFKLLTEKPNALGLSVPGMPIGSPGMEMGNNKEPFDTLWCLKMVKRKFSIATPNPHLCDSPISYNLHTPSNPCMEVYGIEVLLILGLLRHCK